MPDTSEILWKIPPTLPTQRFPKYLRYSLRLLEVCESLRQVKYSCDTSSFTLSEGLVLPLWSLVLISTPSHRPSTFELCDLLMPLSQASGASKLCRWLGGADQRILSPYFIRSSILTYYRHSLQEVLKFNLLTQHVLRASSVGAGSLSL